MQIQKNIGIPNFLFTLEYLYSNKTNISNRKFDDQINHIFTDKNSGMVKYQIIYINRHPNRSDKARMALDLKKIYWKDRNLPRDWYWFEGNISIVSVADRETDCVIIECQLLQNPFDNNFIKELKKNKEIDCITFEQGENFFITIYSSFP